MARRPHGSRPARGRPAVRCQFSNKEDILRALRDRAAGLPIDLATLGRSRGEGGDSTLTQYARRYYRSWDEALRDAGAFPA